MRKSNFELLRLVAMVMIVFHHILGKIVLKLDDNIIYKTIDIPIHVGVICFVLISGYFHIHPSSRAVKKLAFPLIAYYVPLTLFELKKGYLGGVSLFFNNDFFPYIGSF